MSRALIADATTFAAAAKRESAGTCQASGERRLTVKVTRGLGKFGYANSLNFQNGLETDAREY